MMSDIRRIGNKFYDFGTKNESFLLTAQELKTLGIKNWYFMLEVAYPQLGVQDIDPYDEKISASDIGKIVGECKQNPWFFFREVARIPVRGAGTVPLYLHRAGCAAIWSFIHSFDFELVQPRQTYKTTVLTSIMSYMFLFEYQNVDIPYIHKTEKRCMDNVGLLRDYITTLPKYMNPWANMKHLPGLQSLRYEGHNCSIAVVSAAKNESAAEDKSRGLSLFAGLFDECEFVPFMKAFIDGANPTIVQARITARKMGIRSCIMYASTPGNLETQDGIDFQKIIDNLPVFDETLYDKTDAELEMLKRVPTPDEEDQDRVPISMFYIEFNYKQLRKDETWLKEQYYEAVKKGTINEYRRGVLLQRYRGDEGVLFDQADIDYIASHTREPDHDLMILGKFHFNVYEHEIRHRSLTSATPYYDIDLPYLVGIDPASGKNGDNTAIIVVHPYTFQVVGELLSPFLGPLDLMRVIIEVAKLIPSCVFIIETNSLGTAIVDFVQESNLEHRFYHDPKLDASKNAIQKNETTEMTVKRKAIEKGYIGTYLTTQIREKMFVLLKSHVHDYKELLTTKYLSFDIMNLIRAKNGKIEAAAGCHDDLVMAYNHVLYVFYFGFKLERFNIHKELCTFKNAKQAILQYEQELSEEQVNNIVPYKNPDAFENRLLEEMMSSDPTHSYSQQSGRDIYGYRPNDYNREFVNQQQRVREQQESVSMADLSFFYDVNQFF